MCLSKKVSSRHSLSKVKHSRSFFAWEFRCLAFNSNDPAHVDGEKTNPGDLQKCCRSVLDKKSNWLWMELRSRAMHLVQKDCNECNENLLHAVPDTDFHRSNCRFLGRDCQRKESFKDDLYLFVYLVLESWLSHMGKVKKQQQMASTHPKGI